MTQTNRVLALVGTVVGSPVSTEDEAVTALTAQQPEITRIRTFAKDVGAALGETDPEKAVAKLAKIQGEHAALSKRAKDAEEAARKVIVEDTMKKHEKKLGSVPLRTMLAKQLDAELAAGTKLEETETVKVLSTMQDASNLGQSSAADDGSNAGDDMDVKLDKAARALLTSDPDCIELAKTDRNRAMDLAQDKAARQIGYKSRQMEYVATLG